MLKLYISIGCYFSHSVPNIQFPLSCCIDIPFRAIQIEHLPIHMTPSPVHPWLQVQVKPPGVLVQVALVLQLLSPLVAHSSISDIRTQLQMQYATVDKQKRTTPNKSVRQHLHLILFYCHLPMHMTPSPVYPWLQVQVKPPGVLVQVALVLQLASVEHSSISKE